jgi:two-component system, NtrC family, sensor kinase
VTKSVNLKSKTKSKTKSKLATKSKGLSKAKTMAKRITPVEPLLPGIGGKKVASKAPKKRLGDSATTIEFVERLKRQWLETIDAIPDPFLVVSDDYKIIKANTAMSEIAGTDVKKIVNRKCYEVFANRKSPCENCQMRRSQDGESLPGYEIYNARNDRWYEVATRRLQSLSGQHSVVQIYRDRTEAKKLQHQIAQNEKLASIGQLAGGFAHEINNPLGGILVFSQMILREMNKDAQHYPDVVEIESAARRCKLIVENLLAYSRQRPLKPKIETCDIHEIIASALKFSMIGANKSHKWKISLHLNARPHHLASDQNRLTQIFINLISNALQAMPKGGNLTISTDVHVTGASHRLVAKINDNGMGIKPDAIKKVFDPFYTTKEPGQGTGLGLSIVHGIVQDLGGTIEVESSKKSGTTFTLSLPLNASDVDGRPSK